MADEPLHPCPAGADHLRSAAAHHVLSLDEIDQLAWSTLEAYGLRAAGWRFTWDRAVRRAGSCRYASRTISLSLPLFEIEANRVEAVDTILHEVAHALAGPQAKHGPLWREVARQVGARPVPKVQLRHPPSAYVGSCGCGPIHERTRLRADGTYVCGGCGVVVTWARRAGLPKAC